MKTAPEYPWGGCLLRLNASGDNRPGAQGKLTLRARLHIPVSFRAVPERHDSMIGGTHRRSNAIFAHLLPGQSHMVGAHPRSPMGSARRDTRIAPRPRRPDLRRHRMDLLGLRHRAPAAPPHPRPPGRTGVPVRAPHWPRLPGPRPRTCVLSPDGPAPWRVELVASVGCRVYQRDGVEKGCPSEREDDGDIDPRRLCSLQSGHADFVDVQLAGKPVLQLVKRG